MGVLVVVFLATVAELIAQTGRSQRVLDACEDTVAWRTFHSAGVVVNEQSDKGERGNALRFNIAFPKGTGFGGVARNFDEPLPENFEISFLLRATVPVNNFEVKVSSDSAGENIWWVNTRNYTFPAQWKRVHLKRRHFSFAWGPRPTALLDSLRRIEFVVTSVNGGGGSVWIDDLQLRAISRPLSIIPVPHLTASSWVGKRAAQDEGLPGLRNPWVSKTGKAEWIEADLRYQREIGGVRLEWDSALRGLHYDVLGSLDGRLYDTLSSIQEGKGGRVLLITPETELRFLRISLKGNADWRPYRLSGLSFIPGDSLSTPNQFMEFLAADAPRGWYPRYTLRQASYWTIVGVPSDEKEALLNEDGMIEVDEQHFSIEPFVRMDGEPALMTWANCKERQSLAHGYLPIPTVERIYSGTVLSVTPLAIGEPSRSAVIARYGVKNISPKRQRGMLYLAIRPFQVNPSYQWLNHEGGYARTDSILINGLRVTVGDKAITFSKNPSTVGAVAMEQGEIVEHIARGVLPQSRSIVDPSGMASAAVGYSFDLNSGDSITVLAAIPFFTSGDVWRRDAPAIQNFQQLYEEVEGSWMRMLTTVEFNVPPAAQRYVDILRSNLAYILINKDGPGFQPGSRSYERSWIRDGSMTSSALLKLGLREDVRRYIDWYSSYQYENGMVPCVVDKRGPDPVPENDSHGELIFACMEYFRFSHDTTFLRSRWPNIVAAVKYMQYLLAQRMTPEYLRDSSKRAFYGLLPESISHEGYSAKPMHSYWDDFFALKGFNDAAAAAAVLQKPEARTFDNLAHAFRKDVYASLSLAMKNHGIEYIPGCVELGDFDATSTSIALYPCGEIKHLPKKALDKTFDKYYDWFTQRADGTLSWDAYTPYEIRTVGTYIYLGQKNRAHALLEWFTRDQRPQGWNHWAEVVWHDDRAPHYIGDMPHTWVGSDYINAFRAMFVYEIDDARELVLGAGLKDEWVISGLSVRKLATHFGMLSYSIESSSPSRVRVQIEGSVDPRETSILVPVTLLSKPLRSASLDGNPVQVSNGFIRVEQLPARLDLEY